MTKQITVNWACLESIKKAENKKAKLENSGYRLTKTIPGFHYSTLIYTK